MADAHDPKGPFIRLPEAETTARVCDAIARQQRVAFTYLGHPRVIEPHLCGQTAAGRDLVLGFQVGGHSSSSSGLGWRTYLVSEMREVELQSERFIRAREGFDPQDGRFARVHCHVPAARSSGASHG